LNFLLSILLLFSSFQNTFCEQYHYTYTDHLGSILTTTNSTGAIESEQNFDAWGRSRNATNWNYANIPTNPDWQYRGYTGHEHLAQFALINMNGRLYDPILGRMLSPDNNVQLPDYTQNYNRYSYAMNNPLKFTDPDGEFLFIPILIGAAIGGATYTAIHLIKNRNFNNWDWGGFVGALVGGGVGGLIAPALASAGLGGFTGGVIVGGAAGFSSTLTTGIWHGDKLDDIIGNSFESLISGAIIGGVIGGIDVVFRGQRFLDGKGKSVTKRYLTDIETPEETTYYTKDRISDKGTVSTSSKTNYPKPDL
jgi:RHS repeat-associated protein